ncbi:unnamed protein product [Durusdinium trenchii]|uniref:Uncharacterized protein n=1 Tax=Durusdinium trenchii TaxID=1381693 RepID=A0ABP0LYG2_9DINO
MAVQRMCFGGQTNAWFYLGCCGSTWIRPHYHSELRQADWSERGLNQKPLKAIEQCQSLICCGMDLLSAHFGNFVDSRSFCQTLPSACGTCSLVHAIHHLLSKVFMCIQITYSICSSQFKSGCTVQGVCSKRFL